MGVLLAAVNAIMAGAAAVSGSVATRRTSVFRVVAVGQGLGVFYVAPFLWFDRDQLTMQDFALGLLAGALSTVALLSSFHGARHAKVGIISAVVGALGTMVPALFNAIVRKDVDSALFLGLLIGLAAIALLTRNTHTLAGARREELVGIGFAAIAGVAFGLILVAFSYTTGDTNFLVSFGLRLSIFSMVTIPILLRGELTLPPGVWLYAILPGVCFFVGDIALIAANQRMNPTAVSTVAGMYPAFAALFAFALLREKLKPSQWAGVALALVAIAVVGAA